MLKNLEEKNAKDIESLNLRLETMKIASYEASYEASYSETWPEMVVFPKTWKTTYIADFD